MPSRQKSFIATIACGLWQLAVCSAVANDSQTATQPGEGVRYSLGDKGLAALSYDGQSLLDSEQKGELRARSPQFSAQESVASAPAPLVRVDQSAQTVSLSYPWGGVSSRYHQTSNRLVMTLQITNSSDQPIATVPIVLAELKFPTVPNGKTFEAGQFGFGFKGAKRPIGQIPLVADPRAVVPVIEIEYGSASLTFCSDDLSAEVEVAASTNPPDRTAYPFEVLFRDVPPGTTRNATVSLRFGPTDSATAVADDVLKRFVQTHPFQLKWEDRRPIGMIFLASSGINLPANPRRWIVNEGKIEVTTEEGKAAFREALLGLADRTIKLLKEMNAQGMITWDPEGQEFPYAVYYGDPRLASVLAPEMEFKGEGKLAVIDEYFGKFREAGLKVGVCLRPQEIKMVKGKPAQGAADNQSAASLLKDQIAYAKKRWGCTLFYVDSTVTAQYAPLDPDVFQNVAEAFPDVLLTPENESMRYFAYTAPLNSYIHHRITSTPLDVLAVYKNAFSVLMAPDGDKPEDHDALVAAVRRGDILLFRGWYADPGNARIKAIYDEAGRGGQ